VAAPLSPTVTPTVTETQTATAGTDLAATPTVTATAPAPGTPDGARAYVFPVQPVAAAHYERFHHDYPATDIFCPIGSNFVAPTAGVVDFVRLVDVWDPQTDDAAERGGISLAIVGDDGVRYYGAHLSAVTPGIVPGLRVRAGEVLGKTGKTGNARFTDPHLHFGISHPTTPDDWAVRRGEITP
jgi:murein DD-endopeptidase MepM/ murein hydrolase activator NlpD